MHDRTAEGSPELLRLSLSGVGRGEMLAAAAPGEEVVAHDSRVEIRRPGLVEWYVNSEAGLEQGFTLDERPDGEGPLVLKVAVAGAQAFAFGDAVLLETENGRHLRYGKLAVVDAERRPVRARFEVASRDAVEIAIDDAHARYPLVIDPLLAADSDALLRSDQIQAQLGASVAGAGDVNGDGYADVILGAPNYDAGHTDEGAAFVFHGSAKSIGDVFASNSDDFTISLQDVEFNAATQLESNQGGSGSASPSRGIRGSSTRRPSSALIGKSLVEDSASTGPSSKRT